VQFGALTGRNHVVILTSVSTQEIIAGLSKLSRAELEEVGARLRELLQSNGGTSSTSWGAALVEVAGTAEGLPEDFAHNHDHYLHGAARR
jgi:hypothetical protein